MCSVLFVCTLYHISDIPSVCEVLLLLLSTNRLTGWDIPVQLAVLTVDEIMRCLIPKSPVIHSFCFHSSKQEPTVLQIQCNLGVICIFLLNHQNCNDLRTSVEVKRRLRFEFCGILGWFVPKQLSRWWCSTFHVEVRFPLVFCQWLILIS